MTHPDTTTTPLSRLARATRERWPACRAPMVGTKPTSVPPPRAASVAARSSALVATARTAAEPPQQLQALVGLLALDLALQAGLDPAAGAGGKPARGGRPVGHQPGHGDVHVDDLLLAGQRLGVHRHGAAVAAHPRPGQAGL